MARPNAFRKSFLTPEFRARHADEWSAGWANQPLTSELCADVLLTVYEKHFGTRWLNSVRKHDPSQSALKNLEVLQVRALPGHAAQALLRWAKGDIEIQLFKHVPDAFTVLQAQAHGRRCASLMIAASDIRDFEHEGRDFVSFLIHDLVHAQLLTRDKEAYADQIEFARLILRLWPLLNTGISPAAKQELEYLAADMNSHIVHLLKTLKSWIERHNPTFDSPADKVWSQLWDRLNAQDEPEEMHRQVFACWRSFSPCPIAP